MAEVGFRETSVLSPVPVEWGGVNAYARIAVVDDNFVYGDEPFYLSGSSFGQRRLKYDLDGDYIEEVLAPTVNAYVFGSSIGFFVTNTPDGAVIASEGGFSPNTFYRIDDPQGERIKVTIYSASESTIQFRHICSNRDGSFIFWVERPEGGVGAVWKKASYNTQSGLLEVFDSGPAIDWDGGRGDLIGNWCDNEQDRTGAMFVDDSFCWVVAEGVGPSHAVAIYEINENKEFVKTESHPLLVGDDFTDVTCHPVSRTKCYALSTSPATFWTFERILPCGPIPPETVTPFIIPCEAQIMGFVESPRFPEDIAYGSAGGPGYSTTVITMASGHEQRNVNWEQSRHRYRIGYGTLERSRLEQLIAFFHAVQGRAYGFRMKDYHDYKSSQLMSVGISSTDQEIGVGDGVTVAFQLVKQYKVGTLVRTRDIRKPVSGTVIVSLDNTPQPSGWTVDDTTGVVTFDVAPAAGVSVKAGYEFDVPVRFDVDEIAVSLVDKNASAVDVPIVEIRV